MKNKDSSKLTTLVCLNQSIYLLEYKFCLTHLAFDIYVVENQESLRLEIGFSEKLESVCWLRSALSMLHRSVFSLWACVLIQCWEHARVAGWWASLKASCCSALFCCTLPPVTETAALDWSLLSDVWSLLLISGNSHPCSFLSPVPSCTDPKRLREGKALLHLKIAV